MKKEVILEKSFDKMSRKEKTNFFGGCLRKKPYTYITSQLQIRKKLIEKVVLNYYRCKFCRAIHLTSLPVEQDMNIYYQPDFEDKLCYLLYQMGFK